MVYGESGLVSYVALEESTTAVINLKTFKAVLSSFFLVKLTFQINFIREIPVFWGWSDNDLRVLYSSYTRRKCQQEEPVYIQGDKANSVYIVKQGTFRVS